MNTIKAKKITVNAITFSYTEKKIFYISLANAFNEYAKNNNLDVELNMEVLTPENSTSQIIDYSTMMDENLSRKKKKYDIYFYYGSYSYRYSKHLVDLRDYIDENVLKEIAPPILLSGEYDGVLAGLPYSIDISALYSNKVLLDKYGKDVPKTWDELIETARFILQKEKEENPEANWIGYNGQINEESTIVSAYTFIHSFRNSNESPHPEINSQTTIDALEKLRYLKDQISSDEIFQQKDDFTSAKIFMGGALFLQFWYLPNIYNPMYVTSALPGYKSGVSGSIGLANSLGICKYIGEDRIKAAAEVVKFIVSKDTQRNYVIPFGSMSAIPSLYEEDQVCKMVNCEIIKAASPLTSMEFTRDGFGSDDFNLKYRGYIMDYLYRNMTSKEAVENIHKIIAIHNLSLDTNETKSGLVLFIIVMMTLSIMVCSTTLLFIKALGYQYAFLKKPFWLISIFGTLMIMCAIFTLYGDVTKLKCHFKLALIFGGYYVCILPLLCKLIMNIPQSNPYSLWVKNNQYVFMLLMVFIELCIHLTRLLAPLYKVEKVIAVVNNKHQNFEKCEKDKGFGVALYYIEVVWLCLVEVCMLFLIFIEWNLKSTSNEVRFITASVFVSLLAFIMYAVINIIKLENYIAYNLFYAGIIFVLSFSNYFFIYGIRIVQALIRNEELEEREAFKKNKSIYNTKNVSTVSSESADFSKTGKVSTVNAVTQSTNKSTSESSKTKGNGSSNILKLHYTESYGPNE